MYRNTGTTSAYASARMDGLLDCRHMKVGILKTPLQSTPVAFFHVAAGLQSYPVWAIDRLAAVVYCYGQAVKESDSPNGQVIEVNLAANLAGGEKAVCVVAWSIHWHTSKKIRDRAEAMIAAMTSQGANWARKWPFQETLQMPLVRPNGEKG